MILDKFSLTGKVAVVTGGSRGIGRAVALGLAECGADVVISSRKSAACEAVVAEIQAMGRRAMAVTCDVSDEAQVENLFAQANAQMGRIDILINNAGMNIFTSAMKTTLADWNQIVNVNLTGTFLCSRAACRYMVNNGGGRIVNISSTTAHTGNPFVSAYSAAKAGVEGLTRQLAMEWLHRNIQVNCLAFGIVGTDLFNEVDEVGRKRLTDRTPMKRAARTDEVVPMFLLLASDASSFMTGTVVLVDGGWTVG